MEELKLTKGHWLNAKQDTMNIILTNMYVTKMAYNNLKMIEEEIKKFPEEEVKAEVPIGVQ